MKEHILIDKACIYKSTQETEPPAGCIYDRHNGFWRIDNCEKSVMMKSDLGRKPSSKKWDIETGEDQKGE